MKRALLIWSMVALAGGCDSANDLRTPTDLKSRFPALDTLTFALPGKSGAVGTSSETLFKEAKSAQASLGALALLADYYDSGGTYNRDLSIMVALEGAPRFVDQVVRFNREGSRLDVERIGDHALFYLQAADAKGFDPDNAITTRRMVIDGSTVVPAAEGQRAPITLATGLADAGRGYLRLYFNRRPQETDAAHEGAQLDYSFKTDRTSLHLIYFARGDYKAGDATLAYWYLRKSDGTGFVYVAGQKAGSTVYRVLGQHRQDGGHAVWAGDGKLQGCYDAAGTELGTAANPAACGDFKAGFATPPAGPKIWPALPAGIPK
jgi:hypothetical protein